MMNIYPRTHERIQEMLDDKVFPGAVFAFIDGDKVQQYTTGVAATFPAVEPLREGMLYDLASVTKVVVTTPLLLQLFEEGKFSFDQTVQSILPAFASPKGTIRHLLTHTSDINGYIKNRDGLSAEELRAAILQLEPGEKLGKAVKYTDTGFVIAGFIIEALTGKSVAENFEERIKQPLKIMKSTYFPADPMECTPTQLHPVRGLIRGTVHDPKAFVLGEHCGSAGLFATLSDMVRFSQMMLHEGEWEGARILKKETVRMLLRKWGQLSGDHRSVGWNLLGYETDHTLLHTGYTGTFLVLDPIDKQGFIFFSNRVHTEDHNPEWIMECDKLIAAYQKERKHN